MGEDPETVVEREAGVDRGVWVPGVKRGTIWLSDNMWARSATVDVALNLSARASQLQTPLPPALPSASFPLTPFTSPPRWPLALSEQR